MLQNFKYFFNKKYTSLKNVINNELYNKLMNSAKARYFLRYKRKIVQIKS